MSKVIGGTVGVGVVGSVSTGGSVVGRDGGVAGKGRLQAEINRRIDKTSRRNLAGFIVILFYGYGMSAVQVAPPSIVL
jgi:hypothetical protein